nr:PREDICTED: outer envelope pore protein 24, chloroplastic-like [Musa acuminata subsp. malaccensis]
MKATLKGRYEVNESASAVATFAIDAGDVRLQASISDATFVLSLEKPGAFILDCHLPTKFMNSIRLMENTVNLTYTHAPRDNRAAVDDSVALDFSNKVSVSYSFGTPGACKDVSKNAWDFALTRKFEGEDSLEATYHTTNKNLGIEWSKDSIVNGCFKISATVNLAELQKVPKLIAESTWNYDM